MLFFFFFFQAEDGIRDHCVTGVQTCALPICRSLMQKPMIVVATKLDATTDRTRLATLGAYCLKHSLEFHSISAVAGEGVKELVRSIADALEKIPRSSLERASTDESVSANVPVDPPARHAVEKRNS